MEPTTTPASQPAKEKIGIRNVTGRRNPHWGSVRSINMDNQPMQVEPGNAVAVPATLARRLLQNKDSYGQLIWEECAVTECNNNAHRRRAYMIDTTPQSAEVDQEFVDTVEGMINNATPVVTIAEYISGCDSSKTLAYMLRQFTNNPGYNVEIKDKCVQACVTRISQLKKAAQG